MPRLLIITLFLSAAVGATVPTSALASPPAIADYRDRPAVENALITERLNTLLPRLMREAGVDMWLVIAREYNNDPVFLSLVPKPRFTARRTTMLMFHDRGEEDGVERLTISRYPLGSLYDAAWEGGDLDAQWTRLAELVAERDPQRIAINVSDTWPVADGLTHGLHQKLTTALGTDLASRLVSAEALVVRWLETRTPAEVEVWQRAVAIARATIADAFSDKVITPGVTTLGDVAWYIRSQFENAGLEPWFHPDVNRQWQGADYGENPAFLGGGSEDTIIRRGDLLHTDVGLCYLGLCTDTQEMAYVLKLGEDAPPQGLRQAMTTGNHWQDVLTSHFQTSRSGNEILAAAQAQLADEGITHAIYTHPLGVFGHAPGPTIGMWDNQGPTPGQGDWPLHPMTGYAIEGNVTVNIPEWDNEPVQMKLEQSAFFDGEQVFYLGGRQTRLHIVR
ncbi:MAG: M24 family metallopeptidase [Halieaceae bacterium]|jgi:Xaa-Pro aminopeptidase|nr:M24 family metallopeptidase [Halieaceae bacterium]